MKRPFFTGEDYPEPALTYDEIDRMFQAHPPAKLAGRVGELADDPGRTAAVEAFNARLCWYGPVTDELVEFYRKRISRALDEIEKTPAPEEGVIVWKMYSSGTIIKSREGTFAFEVVEGPAPTVPILPEDLATAPEKYYDPLGREKNVYLPPIAKEFNTGPLPRMEPPITETSIQILVPKLFWTPAMRQQYVRLIDASFHSHLHYDHFPVMLTAELLKAGKPVCAPLDTKQMCIDFGIEAAEQILTLPQDRSKLPSAADIWQWEDLEIHSVAGVQVINYPGYQDEYTAAPEGGRLILKLNPNTSYAVEMYAYLVKLGGLNLFWPAEVRGVPGFYPWMVDLLQTEWQPDVCLASFSFERARSLFTKLFNPIFIRLHQLQFGTVYFALWEDDPRPDFIVWMRFAHCPNANEGNELFWGEHVHLLKQ